MPSVISFKVKSEPILVTRYALTWLIRALHQTKYGLPHSFAAVGPLRGNPRGRAPRFEELFRCSSISRQLDGSAADLRLELLEPEHRVGLAVCGHLGIGSGESSFGVSC